MFMIGPEKAIGYGRKPARRAMIAALFAVAAAASAQDAQAGARDYASRDVAGWTVAASKDGKGCFLTRAYDRSGGTTLLIGLDADGSNRLTVLNANWSVKPKDRLELGFRLSNSSYPRHFAVGITSEGKQGFVTSFGAQFPRLLAGSRFLHVSKGDVPVERLSLDGSGAAIAALRDCVATRDAAGSAMSDGKEAADSIPKDPFAPAAARKAAR